MTVPVRAPAAPGSPGAGSRLVRRRSRRAPLGLTVPALVTVAVVNLPLLYILVRSFEGGVAGVVDAVVRPSTLELAGRTLALAAAVAVVAVGIALPWAWLVTRTDLPGRRIWAVIGALPLVFPSYVAAFALVAALGPRGWLQTTLAPLLEPLGVTSLPPLAYGFSGALACLALVSFPFVYLPLLGALASLDPACEESSRSLGRGRFETFRRVVLPRLRPSLAGGSLLVVLYTLSDFGAVSLVRYDTFTLAIYTAYRGLYDRGVAASLALVLVVLTLLVLWLEARVAGGAAGAGPDAARPSRRARPIPLGRWRWPAMLGLGAVSAASVGLPLAVIGGLGLRSLALRLGLWPGAEALGAGAPGPVALASPARGLVVETLAAAGSSLGVSLVAAVLAALLSVPVAAWAVRHPGRLSRAVERLVHSGYALPGLVVALAIVFTTIRLARPLYQTLAALVLAYVVRFLPEALAAVRPALAAVSPAFEEAGRSLGRGPWTVLGTITLPLVRPGVLAGGALVFLTAMKELPATLILRPIGFETLATRIWDATVEGLFSQAALPALVLVAVSAPPMWWLVIRPALAVAGVTGPTSIPEARP